MPMTSIKDCSFFCSWSGGKDSCLALHKAIRNGGIPKALLTMLTENGERTRSHGLPVELVQCQADKLGIPLVVCKSSWDDYEENFVSTIRKFKKDGIECGVFGDIDLEPHLQWVERVCSSVGIQPYEPLWKQARRDLLNEFLDLGFQAMIVAAKEGALDKSFLGRLLDQQVIDDIEKAGCDASGEEGEYHTVVTDGPIYSSAIKIKTGGQVRHDGYCFLDVSV